MEKIKSLPIVLFCLGVVKMLIVSPTIADALCLGILAGVSMIIELRVNDKIKKELLNKIVELEVSQKKNKEEIDGLRTAFNSKALGSALKPVGVR